MTILLVEKIGENLALRNQMDKIDLENNIIVDFTGVKFTSRAFVHEYITAKQPFENITEINMNEVIKKMFNVVQNSLK